MRARNPMPQDVLELLESRGLRADYDQRPAYQRNDYLGWIDRAKLPATRERRIAQMLDELARGGVYMGMEHRPSRKEKDATSSGGAEVGGPEAPDVVAGPRTADEYLEAQPAERRLLLDELRATVVDALPGAEETISWQMPSYRLDGKLLLHFAGYASHVGIYPGAAALDHFAQELGSRRSSKGTLRLEYDEPLPRGLVTRICLWLAGESD